MSKRDVAMADKQNDPRPDNDERSSTPPSATPTPLREVQVRQLWKDHYRVNVMVGVDAASVRVAHSYFVETDGDGNVLAATPKITKLYQRVAKL